MFGHFLYHNKELVLSDLEHKQPGTPIVALRGNRLFQFGIYGNRTVICQHCRKLGSVIVFTVERWSAKEFCNCDCLFEYTPDFDFDPAVAYANACYYYEACKGRAMPAAADLLSVYGDDFALICMVGYEAFANAFHQSRMGLHFKHTFYMAGMAPAQHHLLAIEEGSVIHFSQGDGCGTPRIILEAFNHVEERASVRWNSPMLRVKHPHEELGDRLKARNRALLVFAGYVPFGSYGLMTNNCEHFVNWCKTGKSYSSQVSNFFIDAASILASLLLRTPTPALTRYVQRRLYRFR